MTTAEWVRSIVDGRILNIEMFHSEVVRLRTILRGTSTSPEPQLAKRLLLVYQLASCALETDDHDEERNIRRSFLRDSELICAHSPDLLGRLHLYFAHDLKYVDATELDASDRQVVLSEILDGITEVRQKAASGIVPFRDRDAYARAEAAVWGNLSWQRLLEEETTERNVKRLLQRWVREPNARD